MPMIYGKSENINQNIMLSHIKLSLLKNKRLLYLSAKFQITQSTINFMKRTRIKSKKKLMINSHNAIIRKIKIKKLKKYKGKVCLKIDLSILRNRNQNGLHDKNS